MADTARGPRPMPLRPALAGLLLLAPSALAAQPFTADAQVRLQDDARVVGLLVGETVQVKEGAELIYLSDGSAPIEPPPAATPTEPLADASAARPALGAPFPNPTPGRATVPFALGAPAHVRLTVHDALGREVAVLAAGPAGAGPHAPRLDAAALPAGLYLVRLVVNGAVADTGRLTRVR